MNLMRHFWPLGAIKTRPSVTSISPSRTLPAGDIVPLERCLLPEREHFVLSQHNLWCRMTHNTV